jgi:acyl carrier protein
VIREQLLSFVNADVSLDPSVEIAGDTDLLLTGLVDSVGLIEIVGWLEDEVGIDVDPVDVVLGNFQTVDKMVALVERIQNIASAE